MNLEASIYILSIGFAIAIALLHLFLYLFYPRERANLYFSILTFAIAVRTFSSDVVHATDYGAGFAAIINLAKTYSLPLAAFAFVLFLYAAFSLPVAKQFWIALALWSLFAILQIIYPPFSGFVLGQLFLPGIIIIESLRIIFGALVKRQDGAWIIGAGVLLAVLAPAKDALELVAQSSLSSFWNTLVNQLAVCGIITANSIFLARNFARTNRNLEAQLVQVRELSARELEHERTAAELRLQSEHSTTSKVVASL